MNHLSNKFYLNKERAKWLGVCAGMADYTGVDVTLIRIVTFVATLMTFPTLLLVYWLIAWIGDPAPQAWYDDARPRRSY